MIRETATGVEIDVRVIPRARKTESAGIRHDAALIRVAAPPVEGAANDALVAFFADALRVPRRAVRLVGGEHSRHKRLAIDGVSAEAVRQLVGAR